MISKEKLAKLCQLIKRNSFAVCLGLAPTMLLIAFLFTFKFGCNVIVDGKIIGTAQSKDYVYNLVDSINEEFAPYFDGNDTIAVTPVTTPKLVFKGRFTSEQKLSEALKATCPYLNKAYSIKSNGTTVVAFKTEKERNNAYNEFISKYADVSKEKTYSILDDVEFVYESVPYGMIKSGDSAVKMLGRSYKFNDTVKVGKNTSLEDILVKYNITEEKFSKLNPSYKTNTDAEVKISSSIPYIRVVTNRSFTEREILRYRTHAVSDDNLYHDETQIETVGENGLKSTSKTIYSVNGKVVCNLTTDVEVKDAVDEVMLVGVRQYSKGKAIGDFSSPYAGKLTSRFGRRDGRNHHGIDVVGTTGDPLYAANGGEVVYADWESGYGLVVKIDHKNGYTTFYAHCDELFVKVGDQVAKGQKIAALGNTGRSTAPHIHFEVRDTKTNTPLDPFEFVAEESVQK